MTHDRSNPTRAERLSGGSGVGDRQRSQIAPITDEPDQNLFDALFDAAVSRQPQALRDKARTVLATGVTPKVLADVYAPALARKMGDMWCADTMGFAEVTIGVARLQALLRDLGPEWQSDLLGDTGAPLILLVTLRDAQHTLGAILLTGQLRRAGFAVRLALDATSAHLSDLVGRLRFDAVFVSASQSESLDKIRRMVDLLREMSPEVPRIAVGGGILDVNEDVARVVGADIATSNIDEAIRFCGLNTKKINTATSATET